MVDPLLGIDLGTTHSLVGVVDGGFPLLLADAEGRLLTPSAVYYPCGGGDPVVGWPALRQAELHPERVITSVKRLMGWRPGEEPWMPTYGVEKGVDGKLRIPMGGGGVTAVEVSGVILAYLKGVAEARLGQEVRRAVITVPAYFNDGQRQATREAGELAGLEVVRIVNEPTAAALAYGLQRMKEKSRIAVYDFGGGTFDISVLEMNAGVFHVIATHGDTRLGGDDIDHALGRWVWEKLGLGDWEAASLEVRGRLLGAARRAKEQMSTRERVVVELPFLEAGESYAVEVGRGDLEILVAPLIERTIGHCRQVVRDGGVGIDAIDRVVLVGGSTRMPAVREAVAGFFQREPDLSQNPDEAVAKGAVVQAGILSGAMKNMVLLAVTPLSWGVETVGGLMNVIIPRNSTIPVKAGEMFTNAVSGQQSMRIRVLQGEREMARDNWELGRVDVPFEQAPRGPARVGVQFSINEDGILEVLARDVRSGRDAILKIEGHAVDVEDGRVEEMVSGSLEYAFQDMRERIWTEAKLKAEELLPAVEQALALAGGEMDGEEREAIMRAELAVREAMGGKDANALKAATSELDKATEALAARMIEQAMEESLQKKGIL